MLKIAFVTPKFIIGGAESYIIVKSQWLISRGYKVVIISEGGNNVPNIPQGVEHVYFETDICGSTISRIDYEKYLESLSFLLISNSIDLIEAHNVNPAINVAQCFERTKIPFCVNVLSERSLDKELVLGILIYKLNKLGLYYTLCAEMNVYIENSLKRKLKPKIIPIPVHGIPFKFAQKEKFILSVSRMSQEKMYVKYLIEGFRQLLLENIIDTDLRLIIVGDGPLFKEINDLANAVNAMMGRCVIEMKGTVIGEELYDLYRKCMLYVGVGTTLLLGASAQKPCLLPGYTDKSRKKAWGLFGENADDVMHLAGYPRKGNDGKSYYLYLKELLDPKASLRLKNASIAAERMFLDNYNVDSILQRWEQEYKNIVEFFSSSSKISPKEFDMTLSVTAFRLIRKINRLIKK